MEDEPLLSPTRLARAVALWVWFMVAIEPPLYIPLRSLVLNYRRPNSAKDRY